MTTITQMETTPEQWGVAPYTVRKLTQDMRLKTNCPTCSKYGQPYGGNNVNRYMLNDEHANRHTLLTRDEEGGYNTTTVKVQEAFNKYTYTEMEVCEYIGVDIESEISEWDMERVERGSVTLEELISRTVWRIVHGDYTKKYNTSANAVAFRTLFTRVSLPCPDCANGQLRSNRYTGLFLPNSTGYVKKLFKDVKVNAHYPAWPQGTTFPSKYDGCDCEACGKTIRKSGTYAVVAKRDDGTSVGMFVGNACIKKFGFKAFKTQDAQAESWAKKVSSRSSKEEDMVIDVYYRSKKTFEGVDVTTVDDLS